MAQVRTHLAWVRVLFVAFLSHHTVNGCVRTPLQRSTHTRIILMSSTGLRILVIALTTAGILAAIVAGPYPLGHVQLESLGLAPEADTADRSYSRMSTSS